MAAEFKIELEGERALTRSINSLEKKLARKVVRTGLKRGAESMKNAIQHEVPVRTGKLVANLYLSGFKTSKGTARVEVMLPKRDALGIPADAPGYYPAAILYGTKHMPPNDFIGRAYEANAENAKRIAIENMKIQLVKALK